MCMVAKDVSRVERLCKEETEGSKQIVSSSGDLILLPFLT